MSSSSSSSSSSLGRPASSIAQQPKLYHEAASFTSSSNAAQICSNAPKISPSGLSSKAKFLCARLYDGLNLKHLTRHSRASAARPRAFNTMAISFIVSTLPGPNRSDDSYNCNALVASRCSLHTSPASK